MDADKHEHMIRHMAWLLHKDICPCDKDMDSVPGFYIEAARTALTYAEPRITEAAAIVERERIATWLDAEAAGYGDTGHLAPHTTQLGRNVQAILANITQQIREGA